MMAIIGAHTLLYTTDPEALRATLRDAFGWKHVDAGDGWLIFALPPAELGVHPAEGPTYESGARHQLTFMCDDIRSTMDELRAKGIEVKGESEDEGFGITVMLGLPGGVEVMLYEPRHPTAISVGEQLAPILHATDGRRSAEWYARLGFEVKGEHRFAPGLPLYMFLRRGDVVLHLSEHKGDARPGALIYLSVDDIDAVAAEFEVPVETQPWAREVELEDPDRNRWRIGERISK